MFRTDCIFFYQSPTSLSTVETRQCQVRHQLLSEGRSQGVRPAGGRCGWRSEDDPHDFRLPDDAGTRPSEVTDNLCMPPADLSLCFALRTTHTIV